MAGPEKELGGTRPSGTKREVSLATAVHFWPTPTTQEIEHPDAEVTATGRRKTKDGADSHSLGLADAVRLWPTPTSSDGKGSTTPGSAQDWEHRGTNLPEAVQLASVGRYPTPLVADAKNNGNPSRAGRYTADLNGVIGGALNPAWVEWLMGFPEGWTALKP